MTLAVRCRGVIAVGKVELAGLEALGHRLIERRVAGALAVRHDRHFRSINEAVGIPMILEHVPVRTSLALEDGTLKRLADLPRILGLGNATGEVVRIARLRRRSAPDFLLLSGDRPSQVAFRRHAPACEPLGSDLDKKLQGVLDLVLRLERASYTRR